ncbi:MAG: hypothetical protein CVU48_00885 [Candidatus Cloacimonetes bacterium HGW-Cloacimonetes-1]|jgi:glycosyltransferase involved in cell wall biosynthesis|nr:MAG: hypothetical protein CVU48_00885 [Candidatus Cloacimonetes bacterium HGW-Cloacimonetes-1]
MMFSTVFFVISCIYALFMLYIALGCILTKNPKTTNMQPISVIIAAKNEAQNIPTLLTSLLQLDYPRELYEIIIVDDGSDDDTWALLEQYSSHIRCFHFVNTDSRLIGKKAAINFGIMQAQHDVLAFTDADCCPPSTWLRSINDHMGMDIDYMLGYSLVTWDHQAQSHHKNFERSIYYALATAGMFWKKPITSSACNMVYRKSVFMKSQGFSGIGHIRSGDDDLLLMKMMPHIRKARFCFDPQMCLSTLEADSADKRHSAGIRRASKFRYFTLWLQISAGFVFTYLVLSYIVLFISMLNGIQDIYLWSFSVKTASEILMLITFQMRVKQANLLLLYPIELFYYPLRFIYFALRGTMGNYSWK